MRFLSLNRKFRLDFSPPLTGLRDYLLLLCIFHRNELPIMLISLAKIQAFSQPSPLQVIELVWGKIRIFIFKTLKLIMNLYYFFSNVKSSSLLAKHRETLLTTRKIFIRIELMLIEVHNNSKEVKTWKFPHIFFLLFLLCFYDSQLNSICFFLHNHIQHISDTDSDSSSIFIKNLADILLQTFVFVL